MIGTTAALIGMGIAGAVGSVGSAVIGSNAAKKAASQQAAGAQQAADLATRSAQTANTGISNGLANANSTINQGAANANQSIETGLGTLADVNKTSLGYLTPYMQAGTSALSTIQGNLAAGGAWSKPFDASMMEQYDPGYQFRLQQGQKAVAASQAAKGSLLSGAAMKELTDYEQGAASAEYQNAFSRYMQQIQQSYGMLAGLTNLGVGATNTAVNVNQAYGAGTMAGRTQQGQNLYGAGLQTGQNELTAASMQGQNTMQAAQIAGQAYIGAANAQSAGTIGSANAWQSGIGNLANTVGQGFGFAAGPTVGTVPGVIPYIPNAMDVVGAAPMAAPEAPTVTVPTSIYSRGSGYAGRGY